MNWDYKWRNWGRKKRKWDNHMKEEGGPSERECEGDWMKKGRGEICACVCVHLSIGCNQIQNFSLEIWMKSIVLEIGRQNCSLFYWTATMIVTGRFDPFLRFPIFFLTPADLSHQSTESVFNRWWFFLSFPSHLRNSKQMIRAVISSC